MTTYFSLQGAVFTSDDSGGSAQLLAQCACGSWPRAGQTL